MSTSWARDKKLAERFVQYDEEAWDEFLKRFQIRILKVAVRFCGAWCEQSCPGYRDNLHNHPRYELLCEEAYEAYDFILGRIRKSCEKYRGLCSLDTWLNQLLDYTLPKDAKKPNYHTMKDDFVDKIKGSPQVSEYLKSLPDKHQKLYLQIRYGKTIEDAARTVNLTPEEAEAAREQIADILARDSPRVYRKFAGLDSVKMISLDTGLISRNGENRALELKDRNSDPFDTLQKHIFEATCEFVLHRLTRQESDKNKLLLSLRHDCVPADYPTDSGSNDRVDFTARMIAAIFVDTGDQELTTVSSVHDRLFLIRQRLAREFRKKYHERVKVDAGGITELLDRWGTGDPDLGKAFLKNYYASWHKSNSLQPSNTHMVDDLGTEVRQS